MSHPWLIVLLQAVPVLLADANDLSSLKKMAGQTQVIVSTAGPFAKYGTDVVAASVEASTHYCDITGDSLLQPDS